MRLLVLTPEWPDTENPTAGVFVFEQVEALRRRGIIVDVLSFRGFGRPVRYVRVLAQLNERMTGGSYDLLHAHFGQAGFVAVHQTLAPTVVTFHGSDVFGLPGSGLRKRTRSCVLTTMSQIAASRCNAAIAVSAAVKNRIHRPDVFVVPMGIDLEAFSPGSKQEARRILAWDQDSEVILFVGNPTNPIKRYELARSVVELVKATHPSAELKVCWGVPRQKVPHYYRGSDLLIVTSDHEGGPIVMYEALATNTPIVTVDVGSASGRLAGLDGAVVVQGHSEENLADAVVECLGRSAPFEGRESVDDLHHDRVAAQLERIYLRISGD